MTRTTTPKHSSAAVLASFQVGGVEEPADLIDHAVEQTVRKNLLRVHIAPDVGGRYIRIEALELPDLAIRPTLLAEFHGS